MRKPLFSVFMLATILSVTDPQRPSSRLRTPRIADARRLANWLMTQPIGAKSIRKDCRFVSQTQLRATFRAIQAAKEDTRLLPNVNDCFAFLHSHPSINPAAHGGPGFLPFHRVLLFLYEKMLRVYDPEATLCYWDSSLEPADPHFSSTWMPELFGTRRGRVTIGLGANWITPVGPLRRRVGARGRRMSNVDFDNVLSQHTLGDISFPNANIANNLEESHNRVHVYVGGIMSEIETAAYDPMFWFHHCYVDCVYEWFRERQKQRGRVDPETDWPRDSGEFAHRPFQRSQLGSLRNIDGANNFFSTRVLECERVPEVCRSDRDCGSWMKCNRRTRRCSSDTRLPNNNGFRPQNSFMGFRNNFGNNFQNFGPLGNLRNLGNMFTDVNFFERNSGFNGRRRNTFGNFRQRPQRRTWRGRGRDNRFDIFRFK